MIALSESGSTEAGLAARKSAGVDGSRARCSDRSPGKSRRCSGLSEAQLFQLLDSEQLAAEIIAMKLPQKRLRKPVICVETGWWYPSITAAAKSVYVTQSTVRRAIVNGKTAGGRHWRFA